MKRFILLFLGLVITALCFSQRQKKIDSLEKVVAANFPDTTKVSALLTLSELHCYSEPGRSLSYAKSAFEQSKKSNFSTGKIRSLIAISLAYSATSKYDSSLVVLETAKTLATAAGDKKNLAAINNNIGMAYFDKTIYNKALEHYLLALKYSEEIKDDFMMASMYNNIANLYFVQKEHDKALPYHYKSLAISRKLKNKFKIASSLNNIGIIYRDKNDIPNALKALEESLALAREMENKTGISLLLGNIGSVHRKANELDTALRYYNEALAIKTGMGDKRGRSALLNKIGEINLAQKEYDKCIRNNLEAVKLGEEAGSPGTLYNAYLDLSAAYGEKKNFENAYYFHKLYSASKDSVYNSEKSEQIAEMSERYESEKKDQEIRLLHKDQVIKDTQILMGRVESERQSIQRNALLAGVLLLLALALIIFRSYRLKQKSNVQLSVKNELIHRQKEEVEYQKELVEEKQKEILDSIHYAKRIQRALMASDTLLEKNLPEFFVLYKPKDIVSGDFYWAGNTEDSFLLCTADCTGHGVPGAFMSLLNISLLNETTVEKKITAPDEVLNHVRSGIIKALNPDGNIETKDGMDCSLCSFNFSRMELSFACANNPLWLIRDKNLQDFKADKIPVGVGGSLDNFTLKKVALQKNDCVYTFSDGYADQFGGERGKKFKHRQLQELLLKISHLSMHEQRTILDDTITKWKGDLEQVDDILLIGVRV